MRAEENVEKTLFGLSIQDWSRLPRGPEWVRKRKKGFIVVRTRTVRLSDGSLERFFVLRERPTTKRALAELEREVEILKREVERTRIAVTDRALLRRKNAINGVGKPRRKKSRRRKEKKS